MEDHSGSDNGDGGTIVPPTAAQWKIAKPILHDLYMAQDHPLPHVIGVMKQRGFVASVKMYKARFEDWGWHKYASRPDWLAFARLHEMLDKTDLTHVRIQMHTRIRSLQDLKRYLKNHDEDEAAFFEEAATADVPEHVRYCNVHGIPLNKMKLDVVEPSENIPGHVAPQTTLGLSASKIIVGQKPDLVDWQKLRKMMVPYVHPEPDEPSMTHDELQVSYVTACMGAGAYGAARNKEAMEYCLEQASDRFRQMCLLQNPFILTAANFVLTWLLIHVDGSIPEKIMTGSFQVAAEVLGSQDPVCVLLEWMSYAAAGDKLRTCHINSATLWQVRYKLQQGLGEAHGHSIIATYCLSFHLMLMDREFTQAEELLSRLALVSADTFGPSNILTINTLATLSRAQSRQDKYDDALKAIDEAIATAPLGPNHPHRLELFVRKAVILWKLDRMAEMEALYWVVARGRVATLGIHHRATMAAHESLVDVLHDNKTWEAKKGEAQQLLIDPQVNVTDYESLYRRIIEANRASKDDGRALRDEE